jgi:hypothetical protein
MRFADLSHIVRDTFATRVGSPARVIAGQVSRRGASGEERGSA